MHLNSILLYGALVALTAVLYRRIAGLNWVAALAGLLFAVDAAHAVPAGWLSNRNAMLSALFAVIALLYHDRWRQAAWKPGLPIALVCVALSLLSAEAGVAIGAYLFAYAMFLDPLVKPAGNGTSRTRSAYMKSFVLLFPYLAVAVVWRGVYGALGHGVHGSMLYIDPLNEPLAYLRVTFLHFPIGVMALLGFPDSTAWTYSPSTAKMMHAAAAMAFVAAGTWLIWPLLRKDPRARFFAAGMALAMFPGCATAPMDRNLMFPSIGGMALIAMYIAGFKENADWTAARRPSLNRNVVAVLLVLHLVMSPPLFLFGSYSIKILDGVFMRANHSVPVSGKDGARIVAVNTAWDLLGASLPILSSGEGRQVPLHWAWLSAGMLPVEVTRLDDRTLELRPEGGFLKQPWAQIFRRPSTDPMAAGDRVELEWMTAEVVEVNEEGRPLTVRFEFGTPLEDPAITWLAWSGTKYVPYAPPDLGESNIVPGASALHMLLPGIVPAPKFGDTVTPK